MNLQNKKVLVTGASSGIGQAIAIALAQKGAYMYVAYNSNEAGAKETLAQVQKHADGMILQANLENNDEVSALFSQIDAIDMLVNNAGGADLGAVNDYQMWQQQWQNIFMSAVYCSNAFVEKNAEHLNGKKIVNVSSIYGNFSQAHPELIQYSAAKAALSNFTVALAKLHASDGLQINAVAPGHTATPAWNDVPQERKDAIGKFALVERFVTSEEIAHSVVYLLENDAMTGSVLTVDGGHFPAFT